MSYSVDKSSLDENVFTITTESGVKYLVILQETAEDSGLWILHFLKELGKEAVSSEVFKTMKALEENLIQILEERGITSIMVYISGKDRNEIDQKTKVFTRWIEEPWEYQIDVDPIIRIQGIRKEIETMTNFIYLKKKIIQPTLQSVISENKFCTNCGTENKGFKFCPNCGQNLQQA